MNYHNSQNSSARTVTDGKRTYIGFNTCRLAIRVKAGTTGCNITCPELDEVLTDAAGTYKTGVTGADKKGLFEGEQSNPIKDYDVNGDMYLTWYVQISEKNVSSQPFNFTLTNQLNSEEDYITHFQLKKVDKRFSPLWYVATGDVKGTSMVNGAWEFAGPLEDGAVFTYAAASSHFAYGGTNVNYNGWKVAGVPGPDGVLYHMPTRNEWCSILPDGQDRDDQYMSFNIFDSSCIPVTPAGTLYSEISTSCWGYENIRNNGIHAKSYWGTPSTVGTITKRCAIRYIGTNYCSVWYYEVNSEPELVITIKSKIVDSISESDATQLTDLLNEIESSSYDWSEDNDVIIRQFNRHASITSNFIYYQSTTWRDNDNHGIMASAGAMSIYPPGNRGSEFPYRLFRDE